MADKVTMKALGTMHISNVQADNIQEGDVFQVSEADAKILEDRGLAERGGTASKALNADAPTADRPETREEIDAERAKAPGAKAEASAPANKMAAEPANKTVRAPAKPSRRK